jgi:hypothetical protein
MSIPIGWVDRIFERLSVRYGTRFLDRWKGIEMDDVRMDWSSVLSGLENWPEAISFALDHIDDEKPPTASMFRSLAMRAPKTDRLALPEPKSDHVRVVAELSKLDALKLIKVSVGQKDWAKRLYERDKSGESLNMNQRRCYRAAIGLESI